MYLTTNKTKLTLGVVLPVYHKENPKYFLESLNSIFNQTLQPSEVVVVADGPLTDELENVVNQFLKKYACMRLIRLPSNMGRGIARDVGIKNCSSELICFQDSDDISVDFRFEKQLSFFQNNPDIDVLGGFILEFLTDYTQPILRRKVPLNHNDIIESGKYRFPFNNTTLCFRRKALLEVGGYGDFKQCEDYELFGRMVAHNLKFANLPDDLVYVRIGNNMFTRRNGIKLLKINYLIYRKFLEIGYINNYQFFVNMFVRGFVSLMPAPLVKFFYFSFLREKL